MMRQDSGFFSSSSGGISVAEDVVGADDVAGAEVVSDAVDGAVSGALEVVGAGWARGSAEGSRGGAGAVAPREVLPVLVVSLVPTGAGERPGSRRRRLRRAIVATRTTRPITTGTMRGPFAASDWR